MSKLNKNFYGLWKMTAMKYLKPDGMWESEIVFGGNSVLTEDGNVTTFTRTSELAFGYSGRFEVMGDQIEVSVDVCSIPGLERHKLKRTIKHLTDENLTLGMVDDATGRTYEMDFKLLTRSFTNS